MVIKGDKRGKRVPQCSDVTKSIFHTDHLFHFFIVINHNSYCLFHVLMSIKSLQMILPSNVAYCLLAS